MHSLVSLQEPGTKMDLRWKQIALYQLLWLPTPLQYITLSITSSFHITHMKLCLVQYYWWASYNPLVLIVFGEINIIEIVMINHCITLYCVMFCIAIRFNQKNFWYTEITAGLLQAPLHKLIWLSLECWDNRIFM
jgi:hypothetical protein